MAAPIENLYFRGIHGRPTLKTIKIDLFSFHNDFLSKIAHIHAKIGNFQKINFFTQNSWPPL